MSFRGQAFMCDAPAAAVAEFIKCLADTPVNCRIEGCSLADARGRVLAEPVAADRDSPAFDYSAMDGYAARLADLTGVVIETGERDVAITLPVAGEVRIGAAPQAISGSACVVRIVTGATIPRESDVVVQREAVTEHAAQDGEANVASGGNGRVSSITIDARTAAKFRKGDNIRRRGENALAGDEVLCVGTILSTAAVGTLATVGRVLVPVYSRIRVAIISTGDELVPPDHTPAIFQLRDSNGATIAALLASRAWIHVSPAIHVHDDGEQLAAALHTAITSADAVVITGGVSMGHRDHVRSVVEQTDARIIFHGLPQRPGKPILGAIAERENGDGVPIFGLPGNPISAMVTCARIVIPVLCSCAGILRLPAPPRVAIANPDGESIGLWWHRLVCLDERGDAVLLSPRGSGDIISGGRSDGFIEVPPNADRTSDQKPALYPYYAWPV